MQENIFYVDVGIKKLLVFVVEMLKYIKIIRSNTVLHYIPYHIICYNLLMFQNHYLIHNKLYHNQLYLTRFICALVYRLVERLSKQSRIPQLIATELYSPLRAI